MCQFVPAVWLMVTLSESDGTKSGYGIFLVLRNPNRACLISDAQAFVPKHANQSRASIDSKSTKWLSAIAPLRSGSTDAHESSALPVQAFSIPSKIDLVPSIPMVPVNLVQSELTESMLAPLVNQFGLMQQHMFEQCQQAIAMIVQVFGTMHRDQMEVIRAELDQLRELTEECHALKSELAKLTQNQAGRISSEPEPNQAELDRPDGMDSNTLTTLPVTMPSELNENSVPGIMRQTPVPSSASISPKTPGQRAFTEPHILATQPSSKLSAMPSISEPIVHAGSQPSEKASSTSPATNSSRATVLWLHERIAILQRERESRWQRILKLVPGMSSP